MEVVGTLDFGEPVAFGCLGGVYVKVEFPLSVLALLNSAAKLELTETYKIKTV